MRNKARLSITGSVGENGRVLTPDCPKAVHAGHASLRHPGLAVVSSGLPWKPKNTCRALTTHKHTRTSTKTQTHTYIQKDLYIFSHTRTYMIIATEAQIFRYRETHFYTKHTHTHRIIISHFLLPLTHFTEDWWIQLWSERCRNRAMDNYDVTLACSILFFLIFFLFFFFWEDANIARSSNQRESQHRFPWTMSCEHDHKTDHDDDSDKDDDHSRREEKKQKTDNQTT